MRFDARVFQGDDELDPTIAADDAASAWIEDEFERALPADLEALGQQLFDDARHLAALYPAGRTGIPQLVEEAVVAASGASGEAVAAPAEVSINNRRPGRLIAAAATLVIAAGVALWQFIPGDFTSDAPPTASVRETTATEESTFKETAAANGAIAAVDHELPLDFDALAGLPLEERFIPHTAARWNDRGTSLDSLLMPAFAVPGISSPELEGVLDSLMRVEPESEPERPLLSI